MSHSVGNTKKLLGHVHRAQGLLAALEECLLKGADAYKTLMMASACRGALKSLMFEIIEDHIQHRVVAPDANPAGKQAVAAQQLIDVIRSYLK